MKNILVASVCAIGLVSAASAAPGEKLAQAECDALWMKAGATDGKLSESAAAAYVTDFKAVNPDGDNTLEQDEFRNACNQGMIKSSAATGTSEGTSGAGIPAKRRTAPLRRKVKHPCSRKTHPAGLLLIARRTSKSSALSRTA